MAPKPSTYRCNIFAFELEAVLQKYHYSIDALSRRPFQFEPRTVASLHKSLSSVEQLPALNYGELNYIVDQLRLDRHKEDLYRLYAALIAVGIQRQMKAYYVEDEAYYERVWTIADEVRNAAYVWLQKRKNVVDLFRGPTGEELAQEDVDFYYDVQEAYDEGAALSVLGLNSIDGGNGTLLLGRAKLYLERATFLLENMTPSLQASEEWHYWQQMVQKALEPVLDDLS